ncbi:Phosphoenolpyruvate carboxykinase [GTP] [Gossypium arboreum]|uniref:Phosphoenolpyruvate carboxykinase [GTP] n=1 Tax=Gossypium arboreum TaxID=29729 RepID=A0A0B0M7I8_GOSAR|nr:Phosphoenolpyruvate carboxykinase [GTP] [Gossypium arboreum]KHG19919.1 Phosphoenolpyruvate carboxykinase [GTP] [Gossypium arboreum]
MWNKSVYPLIGTRLSTRACDLVFWQGLIHGLAQGHLWPLQSAHGLDTRACGWPCDPSQYVCPVSARPETRAL